ncbi:MAG: glycosyltransferase [Bacteroidetes bacterium]|nr:glycosyltransferase [Bacteroidota bacterium]
MLLSLYIILVISIAVPLLSYVWFPLFLKLKTASKKEHISSDLAAYNACPPVTIIFSAFNEAAVIERKLQSIIDSDYPKEKLRVLIGSDASTDTTCTIIERFTESYPWITLYKNTQRQGKLNVINDLVDKATTDLLILTDANVFFEPQTVKALVYYLTERKAQQVCANIFKFSPKNAGISGQEIFYMNMENRIKYEESLAYGFVVGVEGGCYGIRKDWFTKVPEGFLMDDFFITLSVVERGGKVLFAPEAVCYEDVNDEPLIEYKRKIRISLGNYRNLAYYKHLLFPFWKGFGLAFLMHKVLRWFTPFALIISFLCCLAISFYVPVFGWLCLLYSLLLILPLLTIILNKASIRLPVVNFAGHFLLMNFALLQGFFKYIFDSGESAWEPPKRNV